MTREVGFAGRTNSRFCLVILCLNSTCNSIKHEVLINRSRPTLFTDPALSALTQLIQDAWQQNPYLRPTASEIVERLQVISAIQSSTASLDFTSRFSSVDQASRTSNSNLIIREEDENSYEATSPTPLDSPHSEKNFSANLLRDSLFCFREHSSSRRAINYEGEDLSEALRKLFSP